MFISISRKKNSNSSNKLSNKAAAGTKKRMKDKKSVKKKPQPKRQAKYSNSDGDQSDLTEESTEYDTQAPIRKKTTILSLFGKKSKRSLSESLIVPEYSDQLEARGASRRLKSNSTRDLSNDNHGNSLKTYFKNNNLITIYDSVPKEHQAPLHIINQEQVKKSFLEKNIPPVLKFKADSERVKNILKNQSRARYDHFFKAKNILDMINIKFPKGVISYYEANFGKKIDSEDCVSLIGKYLKTNDIDGEIKINFAPGLTCSGRIGYHGMENNDPSTRQYVVWINHDKDNQFLREKGMVCLCDHELGTHYYRGYNDGKFFY